MPTVPGIPGPYRFFFFSGDCAEPPHVHVRRDELQCTFWLTPVVITQPGRFPAQDLAAIERIIFPQLLEAWDEHCGS
jgi:hypothetical protein